jgi:KipI family sensor histidine kinase inhibitor
MLGFKPYFPYLIGLDLRLITPRRSVPRINTPKGSVAIGATQTGIYTENSPGGWHIIGHTEFEDYQKFKPGDYLLFKDINSC